LKLSLSATSIKEFLVVSAAVSTIIMAIYIFIPRIVSKEKEQREEPIKILLFYTNSGCCARDIRVKGGFGDRMPDEEGSVSLPGKYLGTWIDIIHVPTNQPIIGMILEKAGNERFVKIPLPDVKYKQ